MNEIWANDWASTGAGRRAPWKVRGEPQTTGGLTSYTPFGYAGGYTDPTGLIYLINRYYDPATGQFLSVDPDVDQTGQPYAYVNGDPIRETDPLGLSGWFAQGVCYCLFADEATFQHALAFFLSAGAAAFGARTFQDPNAYMRKNTLKGTPIRKEDIYVVRYDYFNHMNGWGWINELKVGSTSQDTGVNYQVNYHRDLLRQKHGYGANITGPFAQFKNWWLPISGAAWWFAPDVAGYTSKNIGLFIRLMSVGINVIRLVQDDAALPWPRGQTRSVEEKDTQEIESDDEGAAQSGVDNMLQPCPRVCVIP